MSTASATLIVLAIYAIGLAPLAWIMRPQMAAKRPALTFSAAILVLGLFQTGLFTRGSLTGTAVGHLLPDQSDDGRCREALDVASEAGIVLDSSDAGRLVVREALWRQIPAQVQEALVDCATQSATGSSDTPAGNPLETGNQPDRPDVEIILR